MGELWEMGFGGASGGLDDGGGGVWGRGWVLGFGGWGLVLLWVAGRSGVLSEFIYCRI